MSRHWKAVARLLFAVVVVLVYFAGKGGWLSHSSQTVHTKPYEYVYLDSARVDSYLGQLTGGNAVSENRSETTTTGANVGLQVDTVGSAAASTSKQLTSSAVVTLTEADQFYRLLDDLKKDNALVTVDARSEALTQELEDLRAPPGTMVLIEHAFVHLPPYLSAYPQLRYASYAVEENQEVFEHPPLTRLEPTEVALVRNAKAGREEFIGRAGKNPRLPFTVTPQGMTIVVPARFANLTGDPSLLSTNLTVVGKVAFNGTNFGDGASEATYWPALLEASESFLGYLGVRHEVLKLAPHSSADARKSHEAYVHQLLYRALVRSLSFRGQVMEIIPVAIYD